MALETNGMVLGCPWIHFKNIYFAIFERQLKVHQPFDLQFKGQHAGDSTNLVKVIPAEAVWW